MHVLLRSRIGVRPLVATIGALDLLWLASIGMVAGAKNGHLSLFWLSVAWIEPLIAVLFAVIMWRVHITSERERIVWSVVGVVAGVSPLCWWLSMLIP